MELNIAYEGSLDFYKHKNGMCAFSPKETKNLKKKILKYHIVKGDNGEDFTAVTCASSELGNIICFGETIELAKEKFIKAFKMMCVVVSMINCVPEIKKELEEELKNKEK